MKKVYVYAIICVVLILIGVGGYYFFTGGKDESEEPETIVIGGKEQTSGTESYISMPSTRHVPIEESPYTVYAYNPNATKWGDENQIFDHRTGKCSDGTRDCLYYERVENGRVIDITNKDGKRLVQQFVDDFYDGKLPLLDTYFKDNPDEMKRYALTRSNKLQYKNPDTEYWEMVKPGANNDMPVGIYLLTVMVLYKLTGKPKPNVVIDLPAVKREDIKKFREEKMKKKRETEEAKDGPAIRITEPRDRPRRRLPPPPEI